MDRQVGERCIGISNYFPVTNHHHFSSINPRGCQRLNGGSTTALSSHKQWQATGCVCTIVHLNAHSTWALKQNSCLWMSANKNDHPLYKTDYLRWVCDRNTRAVSTVTLAFTCRNQPSQINSVAVHLPRDANERSARGCWCESFSFRSVRFGSVHFSWLSQHFQGLGLKLSDRIIRMGSIFSYESQVRSCPVHSFARRLNFSYRLLSAFSG